MEKSSLNRNLGILFAVLSAVTFGVWPATARAVYADGGNPVFIIIATTIARALGLGLFCVLSGKPLFQTRTDIRLGATGGFFQALSILGVFGALVFLPGPVMIITLFTYSLMLLFFLAWRREIKLDAITLSTTIAALGGLSLVLDVWHPRQLSLIGIGLALAAAVATMSRFYVWGHQTKVRNPAIVGAEAFLFAALFILALPLFASPRLPVSSLGYFWAFLCCISMIAGTFFTFYGIAKLGSFQFSLLSKLEPIFTAIFSAVLIREFLSLHQYLGILVVLGSLAGYQYITGRQQRAVALT